MHAAPHERAVVSLVVLPEGSLVATCSLGRAPGPLPHPALHVVQDIGRTARPGAPLHALLRQSDRDPVTTLKPVRHSIPRHAAVRLRKEVREAQHERGGLGLDHLRRFANLPTRYFRCHAGEPNFGFLEDEVRDLVAVARVGRARRRVEEPPREATRGNSARFEAGVIWEKPAIPPGGTRNPGRRIFTS